MAGFRHPDFDRPAVSLRQLKALESMILRYLPPDAQLTDLEVLATPADSGNPAPLEVRASITEPSDGSAQPSWSQPLVQEVRAGWPPTDFLFSFNIIEASPNPDGPAGPAGT